MKSFFKALKLWFHPPRAEDESRFAVIESLKEKQENLDHRVSRLEREWEVFRA